MINLRKSNIQFSKYYCIPTWAIYHLVYGDDDSLSDDDLECINDFLQSENLESWNLEIPENIDSEKYFCMFPSFGLGADVIETRFFK